MKGYLLAINHSFILFGATLYCGTLWALRFFWFPTWHHLTVANYYNQFIPQTQAATQFFTVVVPIVFLCSIILIWTEWTGPLRWLSIWPCILLAAATFVGQVYIIPINKILTVPATDQAVLTGHLERWMSLNDIRWVLTTLMWIATICYFIAKGSLIPRLGDNPA